MNGNEEQAAVNANPETVNPATAANSEVASDVKAAASDRDVPVNNVTTESAASNDFTAGNTVASGNNASYQYNANTDEPLTEETIKKQKKSYFASFAWKMLVSLLAIFAVQIILKVPETIIVAILRYIMTNTHNAISAFIKGMFDNGFIGSTQAVLSYIYLIISDGAGILLLFLLTRKKAQKPERKDMKFSTWFVCFMCCFGIGGVGSIIGGIVNGIIMLPATLFTTLFAFVTPLTGNNYNIVQNLIYKDNSWAYLLTGIITVGIVVPLLEELLFRKLLIDSTSKYGFGASILLSGLIFGLFHGNFVQFFYATALGILFAYIYASTGKLRYTALLHMGYNLYASAVIPLARKMIPQKALDDMSKAYTLFENNVKNETMDSLRALEQFYNSIERIITKYPVVVLGILAVIIVYLIYLLLILVGVILMIVFMKKALEFRKTMVLGEKGTKTCAVFNWASILLWVMLGSIFILYYGVVFLSTLTYLIK